MLFLHIYCGAELSAFQRKKKDVHDLLHFLMFAPRKFSSGNTQFDWVNIWVRVRGTGKINLIKQGKLQPISVFCVGVPLSCVLLPINVPCCAKQTKSGTPPTHSIQPQQPTPISIFIRHRLSFNRKKFHFKFHFMWRITKTNSKFGLLLTFYEIFLKLLKELRCVWLRDERKCLQLIQCARKN